jgi:Tol biopolymer transport system component
MRFRGAAAALATLALVAVSGAGSAGTETRANGQIIFAVGPADNADNAVRQFVAADLRSRRTTFTEIPDRAENPALSRDGRHLAYDEWVGEYPVNHRPLVFVQSMKDGSRHSVGRGCDPAWSPSGRRIAFIHVISDDFCNIAELAIVNRSGSGMRSLFTGIVTNPNWSPNGRWIAFLAGTTLYVIRPDGTDVHALVGDVGGTYSWAPDSKRIAVVVGEGVRIAAVAGGVKVLADNAQRPTWSPTGRWIAFERYSGTSNIIVADANGSTRTVVGTGLEPTWIGDDLLVFTTIDGMRSVAHDGSRSRLVVKAPPYVWYHDLQPLRSSASLAFARETIDYTTILYALDPTRETVRRMMAPSVRGADPAVSPDGLQVAFARVRPEGNHVIAVKGTTGVRRVRTLTHNPYGWDYEPAWSPDGHQIVFVRGKPPIERALYVVGVHGGKPRLLWSGDRPGHPAWAPDGRRIAIDGVRDSESPGIRLVVPGTEGSVQITHPSPGAVDLAPSWSPDGTQLAFVRHLGFYLDAVFVLTLSSGEERQIVPNALETTTMHPLAARWSPDGTSLVVPTCVELLFESCGRMAVATMASDGSGVVRRWERPKLSALDVAWAAASPPR